MIYYGKYFEHSCILDVLMNNIVENTVAGVIVTAISALFALFLHTVGVSTPGVASVALLVLIGLFFLMRRIYPGFIRGLTIWLVRDALRPKVRNAEAESLKEQVMDLVTREAHGANPGEHYFIHSYPNQDVCESKIQAAFRSAKKVKILTIRGERYFSGARSILHDICKNKQDEGCTIQVLVLSPGSSHITDALSANLGHSSSERTRRKMQNTLLELRHLEESNHNIQVKCFNETPNFKMLMFDDSMFVSVYIKAKNDRNTNMLRVRREHQVLFTGLERDFDDLWKRSFAAKDVLDGRV
ncbi:MAG TPA: hypothetical protein VGT44_20085 [Ktedonobacteraceae bacterium]|nr:hypothetical protein [Ktedonobacteraceae bacterium]